MRPPAPLAIARVSAAIAFSDLEADEEGLGDRVDGDGDDSGVDIPESKPDGDGIEANVVENVDEGEEEKEDSLVTGDMLLEK